MIGLAVRAPAADHRTGDRRPPAAVGSYRIDEGTFADGLAFFRTTSSRGPHGVRACGSGGARRPTQFYVAYSFYRQGWGRFVHDDVLYREGLDAGNRAIALAPGRRSAVVDDARSGSTARTN